MFASIPKSKKTTEITSGLLISINVIASSEKGAFDNLNVTVIHSTRDLPIVNL